MRRLLDGETLEIVLTALGLLNASGKMIGIISHLGVHHLPPAAQH
jgi:DNA repair exonuclease SbcCD ATPase subunit